jgi:GT2 family glycosyltransferase
LDKTIESLLSQTHPPDEIIVVDDGSSDDSVEIASRFPVTLLQHPRNLGLASARNTALHAAQKGILAYLDVDALAGFAWLQVLLNGYEDPFVAGAGGRGVEVRGNSLADRWRQRHASQDHGRDPQDVDYLYGLSMSYRTEILKDVGGFNPGFRTNAEDMDVGLRLNAAGYRLRYLPEAKVFHQRTDDVTSLLRTMKAWYAGAYTAMRYNHHHPWTLFAGTVRRMFQEPVMDLYEEQSLGLALLSLRVGLTKLLALWSAARSYDASLIAEGNPENGRIDL